MNLHNSHNVQPKSLSVTGWCVIVGLILLCLMAKSQGQPYSESNPPVLPDVKISPGAVATNGATVEQVMVVGFTKTVRNVPDSEKKQVFIRYFGHVPKNPGAFEIDHIISCELNGSQSVENLWPQCYSGVWNARVKDHLENVLAANVRKELAANGHDAAEKLLIRYQQEVSNNWTNAFAKYVGDPTKAKTKHGKATE
jgi:hypothetical protein